MKQIPEIKLLQGWIPVTSKRNLLYIAALLWTFAGVMLLTRGMLMMDMDRDFYLLSIAGSLAGGVLFYVVLFKRISKKYIKRIISLNSDRPSIFSFFNLKGYLMMAGMIFLGILLRKSGFIPSFYLSIVYLTMSVPLFVSSLRFYYSAIHYQPTPKSPF